MTTAQPTPTISLAGLVADLEAIGKMAEGDLLAALKTIEGDVATQLLPALEGLAGSVVTALGGALSVIFGKAAIAVTSVSGTPNEDVPLSQMRITTGAVQGGPSAATIRAAYAPKS